jgi:hypothetical protein
MRLKATAVALVFALLAGCEQPGEIVVREEADGVEVTSLVMSDTSFGMSPIDTSALLPDDELQYVGSLMVNNVRFDAGTGIASISFARVFVGDEARPVTGPNGPIGYHGFHLGNVFLNGVPMVERLHRLPGIDPIVHAGFEYITGPSFQYVPGQQYTWSGDSVGSLDLSIETPEIITVQKPLGGAVVEDSEPLILQWTSEGEVVIIVSRIIQSGLRPMLFLRPLRRGNAVVSQKVLELLPRNQMYVLTFIRANRKEVSVQRPILSGTLLLQAASVHNTVIQLR